MEGEPFHHFSHRGARQRALSRHWGWHSRLSRDPQVGQVGTGSRGTAAGRRCPAPTALPPAQVLWFEQQTVKRRAKRGGGVVPTDPWFPKQWYMVRAGCFPSSSSLEGTSGVTSPLRAGPGRRAVSGEFWDVPREESPDPLWSLFAEEV